MLTLYFIGFCITFVIGTRYSRYDPLDAAIFFSTFGAVFWPVILPMFIIGYVLIKVSEIIREV